MIETPKTPHVRWRRRLTLQLAAMVLLLILLPHTIMIASNFRTLRTQTLQNVQRDNRLHVAAVAKQIDAHLNSRVALLQSLADAPSLRTGDWETAEHELERLQVRYPDLSMLTLVGAEGNAHIQMSATGETPPPLPFAWPDSPGFLAAKDGDTHLGELSFVTGAGQRLLAAVPVLDDSRQEVIGVLSAQLSLRNLLEEISVTPIGKDGYVYVVDDQGQVIAHQDFSLVLAQTNVQSIPEVTDFLQELIENQEPEISVYESLGGESVFGVHVPVTAVGWGVIGEQPVDEALALVRGQIQVSAIMLGASILVSALLAVGLTYLVGRPIGQLTRATQRIAAGDRTARVSIGKKENEIGQLALAFNQMADNVEHAEEESRQFGHIVSSSTDMLAMLDVNYVYLAANEAYLRAFGKTRDELIGHSAAEVFGQAFFDTTVRPNAERCLAGQEVRYEDWFEFPVVGRRYMDIAYFPYAGVDKQIKGLVVCGRDATERKQAEEALRRSIDLQQVFLDNMSPVAMLLRPSTREIVACNKAGQEVGAIPGKTCFETWGQADAPCPWCLAPKLWATGEAQHLQPEGLGRVWDAHWIPVADDLYLHYACDITERKRAEEELCRHRDHLEELVEERSRELEASRAQLQRTERLASIGTFSAGIAHEINNPLGMIMLSMDAALRSIDKPEAVEKLLRQSRQDVERCAHIVKGLLRFARDQSTEKCPVDLNEVVRHTLDFTQEYARKHGVIVETRLADTLPLFLANSTEIEQVGVNLVHNAVHACGEGGRIGIETSEVEDNVRLVVRDDGCGMTEEEVRHVFDPFYTTRLEKGGTGLGLSTVHGIVNDHGGTIGIASEEGKGTTFTIDLPRHSAPEARNG